MGEQLSDDNFIAALLLSLPESYKNLVMILKSMKDLTLEFVIGRLLEEDHK